MKRVAFLLATLWGGMALADDALQAQLNKAALDCRSAEKAVAELEDEIKKIEQFNAS